MMEFESIFELIFGIILMIVGLQILDALYGSGILMFLSGLYILFMRNELSKYRKDKNRKKQNDKI